MSSVLPVCVSAPSLPGTRADRDSSNLEFFCFVFKKESKIGWVLCQLVSDAIMCVVIR